MGLSKRKPIYKEDLIPAPGDYKVPLSTNYGPKVNSFVIVVLDKDQEIRSFRERKTFIRSRTLILPPRHIINLWKILDNENRQF